MAAFDQPERVGTLVIGGGQAGLSVGYHLKQRGLPFVILDANERVGDSWRKRWDSLRLFTPARFDGLAGMPFPAPGNAFITKDAMGDYLEAYAKRFDLPVRSGVTVSRLSTGESCFDVQAGDLRFVAENVVVAMSSCQRPKIPAFAGELDPAIVQLHSSAYKNPSQLREGGVLLVGAGNSGAEIALEVARNHPTWLSGRDTGHLPFDIGGKLARLFLARFVLRIVFHRVLTVGTPIGRKARPRVLTHGGPLIRVKPADLRAAGVKRVPRTEGVSDGRPVLANGRALDVTNMIWCTGFEAGFSWIDLPVHGEREPMHERGVEGSEPGLYFVGLEFLSALSSAMVHGVNRDAEYVVKRIASRVGADSPATESRPARVVLGH